jgi:ABC-2 type transport system ATP-binding protein
MTPASFLDFVSAVRGLDGAGRARRLDEVADLLQLRPVWLQPIETLSKGFKRRVGLGQAILLDPEVLILDEPTDGLDPNQKHAVRGLLREMAAHKAIVISTHILEEVEAICTRAVIIAGGRIVADATPDSLLARSRLYNAVAVTVAEGDGEPAASRLAAESSVAGVEMVRRGGGSVRLLVTPEDGRDILGVVHGALDAAGIAVEEITEQHGRLDDVFRDLTMRRGEG